MALPMNNDFANYELSIEELGVIAAGHWWSSAVNWVKNEAKDVWHWAEGDGLKSAANAAAGYLATYLLKQL